MKIESTIIQGVYILHNFNSTDLRGSFIKTFNNEFFNKNKINFLTKESYYSISKKDVIRGMHFQTPPYDHEKLIYVPQGEIIDVILDLRKKSPTYKKFISVNLSSQNNKSIFIPRGLAHGFKSLENNTITVYNVSSEYNAHSDCGIKFSSFGYDWKTDNPIISKRDSLFKSLKEFNSPF
tara:strand:- start:28172 stop:28708 length:537 start_codon:yes stop_codon:yes gene_type:complete